MPRVKLFDKEEALEKAMILFWEKGFEATSISDLISFLGISKSSFYDTFGSKRLVFESCLNLYMSKRLTGFETLLHSESDIRVGLTQILTLTLDEMLSDKKSKGCLIANTCAELGGRDELIRNNLLGHHQAIHQLFTEYLNGVNWNFNISRESFVDLLMTFVMGMKQEVKYHADRDRFLNSISNIMSLL